MARIKKLKENGKTVYPPTILQAVVDPSTGKTLKTLIDEMNTALTKVNALTLKGHGVVEAGETDPRNRIPVVGTDMVMETGRYLDFHYSGTGGKDYDIRLACNSQNQNLAVNLPTHSGTLATLSDIPKKAVYVTFDLDYVDHQAYFNEAEINDQDLIDGAPLYFIKDPDLYLDSNYCVPVSYQYDSFDGIIHFWFVGSDGEDTGVWYGSGKYTNPIGLNFKG